jgi:thiosulfate/3-mercaptopyruvate sulfurtransferase
MNMNYRRFSFATLFLAALTVSQARAETPAQPQAPAAWSSFVTAQQVKAASDGPNVVVIDARKPADYAKGHIPGAINLPGDSVRTPLTKARAGDSQYIFRDANGAPDIAKYEKLFSEAGLTRDKHVIVYGAHAGKADGSVLAMILDWLGQEKVQFLDGVGVDQWTNAGFSLTTEPATLAPAQYAAKPRDNFVWNLDDVLKNLENADVVFYDTRNPKEFSGEDKRDNARGGHIPGAVCIDYAAFLKKEDSTTLSPAEIHAKLLANGVTPDKTVVLYCQTATRVSLPHLALKDLGYKNIAVYDASWHEYGNRNDTPVVEGAAAR